MNLDLDKHANNCHEVVGPSRKNDKNAWLFMLFDKMVKTRQYIIKEEALQNGFVVKTFVSQKLNPINNLIP